MGIFNLNLMSKFLVFSFMLVPIEKEVVPSATFSLLVLIHSYALIQQNIQNAWWLDTENIFRKYNNHFKPYGKV